MVSACGLYLLALDSRLISTWVSRVGSAATWGTLNGSVSASVCRRRSSSGCIRRIASASTALIATGRRWIAKCPASMVTLSSRLSTSACRPDALR